MSRTRFVVFALLGLGCASHESPPEEEASGLVTRISVVAKQKFRDDDEKERIEQRNKMREFQRSQGLRVCEEGEDKTTWTEDCNSCWCENGERHCTRLGCKTKSPKGEPLPPPPGRGF